MAPHPTSNAYVFECEAKTDLIGSCFIFHATTLSDHDAEKLLARKGEVSTYLHFWAQQVDVGWERCRGMMAAESVWPGMALGPTWVVVEGRWMGRWG